MPDKNTPPESEWISTKGMSPRVAPPKSEGSRKPPGAEPAINTTLEPEVDIRAGGTPRAGICTSERDRKAGSVLRIAQAPWSQVGEEVLSKLIHGQRALELFRRPYLFA